MPHDEDVLEQLKKRRKKKRWLEEEAERHIRPVRGEVKGRR